jgi:predicted metalloprotease
MLWKGGRRSRNIEDRRGLSVGRGVGVAGGGIGTIVIVVIALFLGVDPRVLLQGDGGGVPAPYESPATAPSSGNDEQRAFVATVLADLEDSWHAIFGKYGRTYEEPTLVLFTGAVRSACGLAESATGPFYCPQDHKVYLDLGFFRELRDRLHAGGDFAAAYVIAHEVGHHVQNLLGLMRRGAMGQVGAGGQSVRTELQADCFAGIWAHDADRTRRLLEKGDLEEALGAAAAVGDDRLQRRAQGYVVPESFTHGTSAQRVAWFKRGFASGDLRRCDTSGSL